MADLRVLWWNLDWQSASKNDQQVDAVLGLAERPDVVAVSELTASRARVWRRRLRAEGYEFVRSAAGLPDRRLRVLLASRLPMTALRTRRFAGVHPWALRSARVLLDGTEVDVHAVHVPNGSTNGWVKIDHLRALRQGLQPPLPAPAVLCGDFNTPQSEGDGGLTTFGQTLSGEHRHHPSSTKPFSAERPWDPIAWDRGEREVLEGLPRECGMPDAFRACHPDALEATWVPRNSHEERGRRLDHLFASSDFEIVTCDHIHEWRRVGLSDHSALTALLRLR